MIYGYCRISTDKQSIIRQQRNISAEYPNAVLFSEAFSGTTTDRPEWKRLLGKLKSGDTVVFDSVSRMSRTAEEGIHQYEELFGKNINLIFLKEPHINTETYREAVSHDAVPMTNTDVDIILKAVNDYLMRLARKQIELAFEQSEKEVADLHQRTKEGIATARLNGKKLGRPYGDTVPETRKAKAAKQVILRTSKDFGGILNDIECMGIAGCSRNTYYKYKKELSKEQP